MTQEKIELNAELRTVSGKAVKHLRTQDLVPAVIHDHGKESILIQANYQILYKVYLAAGKHHPVALKAGNKNYTAMIKTVDFNPKRHTISHIVFGAVSANEKIEAEVPVHPQYAEGNEQSPAERASLIVIANLDHVVVEATASTMPDALYYDAEKLVEEGDHITVADLRVPANVEVKSEPEATIATVYEPSALAAANEAAAGDAEPGDEQVVETDVTPEDVTDNSDRDELNPGGRKEKEDNQQGTNPEKH